MKEEYKKRFKYYMLFYRSRIYLLIMFLFSIIIMIYSLEIGIFVISIVILLGLWEISEIEDSQKAISEYTKEIFLNEKIENKNVYDYFPLPFVILNFRKYIERYNFKFEELFLDMSLLDRHISDIIIGLNINDEFYNTIINERYYKIYIEKVELNEDNEIKYILYFWDNTENAILNSLIKKEKTIISLVFIDNYEEVFESMEEVRRPLLVALINRKLNELSFEIGGVIKSFEKDKYIMILSYQQLERLQDKHFNILEQIREISIGNRIPVTLSIGIGVSADNLSQSMAYARIAMDLALGRGGDQAVIKNVDKYHFYGGTTKEVEKTARVKARVKAYALKELIQEAEHVIIMGHKNPDIDSLGSAIGVFKACQTIGKQAHIIINEVTSNIKELYDRLIKLDEYKKGVFINNQYAENIIDNNTLLIIVDVHKTNFVEYPLLLSQSKKTVVFDHHRKSTDYIENAVLSYIEPYASSTSELITEMLQYINERVNFKPLEADALLGGITVDTKNFTVKTGARTFEAAAFLKRSGADSVRVHTLFQNDMKAYKARVTTVKDAEIFQGNLAISVCPLDAENPSLTAAQASDELLSISGIQASFVICKKDNAINISARSLGSINVQVIMEKLGGGGHQTVSGAQISDIDITTAKKKIKQAIIEYFKEE